MGKRFEEIIGKSYLTFLKMVSKNEATDDFTRKLQEIISCVKDGLFSEEVGAKRAGLPLEEFKKHLAN